MHFKKEETSKIYIRVFLQSTDIQEWLVQRFGSNHVYSVDQIESYVSVHSVFLSKGTEFKDWEEELVQPTPLMFGPGRMMSIVLLRDYYDELLKVENNIDSRIKELLEKIVRKDERSMYCEIR
jgi:hypothetical protein